MLTCRKNGIGHWSRIFWGGTYGNRTQVVTLKCERWQQCNIYLSAFLFVYLTCDHILRVEITIRRTAVWYIARFPSHVWIRCLAPGSYCIWIRIATIVLCCLSTAVGIVCIILCSWIWYMRCAGCPRLTRSSIHCLAQSSHVLTPEFSLFTLWTK